MFHRLPLLLLSLLLVFTLWGHAAANPLRVALLQEGGAEDHGYIDNLHKGLQKAQAELGITYDVINTPAPDAQEAAFLSAAKAGYDLIITATPGFHELLMNNAGNFRRVRFAAIDASVKAPNIASVLFADVQAAFLSGFAAAQFTLKTAPEPRVIGWAGAYDTPSQRAMLDAFTQGARLADPQVRVIGTFTESLTDPAAGRTAAAKLFAQNARVIMHAAGKAGLGVIETAKEQQRWAIGMDQDQHSLAPGNVLLSQRKAADRAVFDIIKSLTTNTFPGGETTTATLEDDGVGITALNAAVNAPLAAEISARLKELAYEIKRGGIKIALPRKTGLCDCL